MSHVVMINLDIRNENRHNVTLNIVVMTGIMDVQILREMSSLSAFTQQIAIEPNDSELLRFKARIEEDERLKSITFDWIHATTEGFEVTKYV